MITANRFCACCLFTAVKHQINEKLFITNAGLGVSWYPSRRWGVSCIWFSESRTKGGGSGTALLHPECSERKRHAAEVMKRGWWRTSWSMAGTLTTNKRKEPRGAINHLFPEQNGLPHLTVLIDYDADPTGNGTSLGLNEEHYDKYLAPRASETKTGSTQ